MGRGKSLFIVARGARGKKGEGGLEVRKGNG